MKPQQAVPRLPHGQLSSSWCSSLIAPLLWMVAASFKTNVDIYDTGKAFFFSPTVANYTKVLQQANYLAVHRQQPLGGVRRPPRSRSCWACPPPTR